MSRSLLIQCLSNAADGVRLAARIVDTPCNEMNTDHFLQVSEYFSLPSCFAVKRAAPATHPSVSLSGNQNCGIRTWNHSSNHSWGGTETKRVRRYCVCGHASSMSPSQPKSHCQHLAKQRRNKNKMKQVTIP